MKSILIGFLSVLMILTPRCLFAREDQPIQRQDLFRVGFSQLPYAVDFVARSQEFLAQLTPEEKAQLAGIYDVTESIRNGEFWKRSDSNGNLPDFLAQKKWPVLEFSQEPSEFKINPGEPERLAKTTEVFTDAVRINEKYLNSQRIDPSYSDVLQILFHELGHKLEDRKNQAAVDSVGAKMIEFLRPYFQTFEVVNPKKPKDSLRGEILSLPYEVASHGLGPRETLRLLLNDHGMVTYHVLDIFGSMSSLQQYNPDAHGTGNVMEALKVRMTNFSGSELGDFSFDLKLNFEVQSRLVLDGSVSPSRINRDGSITMVPHMYDLISPSYTNVNASVHVNRPDSDSIPQYYQPEVEQWNYRDSSFDFRVSQVESSEKKMQILIGGKQPVTVAQLQLQAGEASLLVQGRMVSRSSGGSLWQFDIPSEISSASGEVQVRDVIINRQSRSILPEVLSFKVKTRPSSTSERLMSSTLTIFDGTQWRVYTGREKFEIPQGPARFRMSFPADQAPKQIRLRWNTGSTFFLGNREIIAGTLGAIHEETIQDLKLVDSANGRKTYEFQSSGSLLSTLPVVAKNVFVEDSRRRFLKRSL